MATWELGAFQHKCWILAFAKFPLFMYVVIKNLYEIQRFSAELRDQG